MMYEECLSIVTWNEIINKITLAIYHKDDSSIDTHMRLLKYQFDTMLHKFGPEFMCDYVILPDYVLEHCKFDFFLDKI